MRYRQLGPFGDYVFGHSQLDFYRDIPAAVGQLVETRLLLWIGEWFLDTQEGTLWIQGVLGKQSIASANNTLQQRILATQGVVNIQNFQSSIEPNARTYTMTCDLNTIYGPTTVQIKNQRLF